MTSPAKPNIALDDSAAPSRVTSPNASQGAPLGDDTARASSHMIDDDEGQLSLHCGAAADVELDEASYAAGDREDTAGGLGEFLHATYRNARGEREYRLYRPVGYAEAGRAMPLIVMLHGCAHTPENFALGTRMNVLADRLGFLVAYPRQTVGENRAKCWNWYRPDHQTANEGEPSILAGITREIMSTHRVDPDRIFVAGLSAGASMAAILGHTCPTLFRAIGVHSGTPYLSAHSAPSALATLTGRGFHKSGPEQPVPALPVPMIVFQGDHDHVVNPVNADALVRQSAGGKLDGVSEQGRVLDGHSYNREIFTDAAGRARIERWTVHGSGHAWSGGHPDGAYTDPKGPDASAEMVRFFLEASEAGPSRPTVH
ncbi:extracellular catalytic domain type 1 short-chain-length polyhydroxyalkanoate depolymerase [Cognatilysobacter bugurensis]|uniref:PHB depolymerase family esterase n=1 Tax=Cognatilysobacter bugurensis TaxID=543356 RepID=A0A918W8L0_9GAMM|nr:PHB depolymerase family esterase [Lysobacter bugurensis]GHA86132.1 hypothetical protein GCM10007067_25230 [Lysobacter bugurensis]